MDRNEILANYQACTGEDDIEKSLNVLEEHEWNLQNAVTTTLSKECNGLASIEETYSGVSTSAIMLTFCCQLGDNCKEVTLDDSNTISALKEVICIEFGIPFSEVEFESWPKESIIRYPSDDTLLKNLQLPHYNVLKIKCLSRASPTSDENGHLVGPGSEFKNSKPADVDDLVKNFSFVIENKDNNKKHSLVCKGMDTVREFRQQVSNITGISYEDQEWKGFPGINIPDDNCTLASLNLDQSSHVLTIQTKQLATDPFNSRLYNSLPITQPEHPSTSDDEYDINLDDDMIFNSSSYKTPVLKELMPSNVDNVKESLKQFEKEFNQRYGKGPSFCNDTLQIAIQTAFGVSARSRKLLAVYIHHDKSIQSHVFCSQLLCAESIVTFLDQQFVCWPWDITSDSNKNRLLFECNQHLGSTIATTIQRMKRDEFPLLVLARGKNRSCDITEIIKGNIELNELMAKLLKAVDDAEVIKQQDVIEEDARLAREKIKHEQEEAYQKSLEKDRAKILKEEAVVLMKKNEEIKKITEAKALLDLLPDEPGQDCQEPIVTVRFRAPNNVSFVRNFLACEPMQTLINFVGSKGYSMSSYQIVKSWPRTNLARFDPSSSFDDCKFHQQETIMIEEKVDEEE